MSTSGKQIGQLFMQRPASRYSLAAGMSILVHLVLGGYLAFMTLGDAEVLEIREINFIDQTEKPKLNPRLGSEPRARKGRPASPRAGSERAKMAQNQPSSNSPTVETLKSSLPIIPATESRIALARADASDVLRVADNQSRSARPRLASLSKPLDLRKKTDVGTRPNVLGVNNGSAPGNVSLRRSSMPTSETGYPGSATGDLDPSEVTLGGSDSRAIITGPLSARGVFQKDIPSFPRFARRKGVGATITLQFTVMPDGQVKENTAVVRTSGSAAWDDVVVRSLKRWRFAPLTGAQRQDQTGTITFQFVID